MNDSVLVYLIAILIVGVLIFLAISMTRKPKFEFDKEQFQLDLMQIERALSEDNKASYAMTIVNCDKLLDKAMIEKGISGKTMGDRLKKAGKDEFSQLNSVWYVHKMRNQIAHEHDFSRDYKQAKRAINVYRQALRDLGAI